MSRRIGMPPALARLFSGTSLAQSAATAARTSAGAPPEDQEEDEDEGGTRPPSASLSAAERDRIATNAAEAVQQAETQANDRWATVMRAEVGEGDGKQALIASPARLSAAIELLADTDLAADKIIATVSKPAFNASAPAGTDAAHAAARERMRGAGGPDTGAAGTGGAPGGDGTGGTGTDIHANVKASRKKLAEQRNASVRARMGKAGTSAAA